MIDLIHTRHVSIIAIAIIIVGVAFASIGMNDEQYNRIFALIEVGLGLIMGKGIADFVIAKKRGQ